MNVRAYVVVALTFAVALAAYAEETADAQARMKAVVAKYMNMPGDPAPGIVLEMAEFVDREQAIVTVAEAQIIEAVKKAGIPVLAKGKPQFIVYGGVQSNWGGQQNAFGTDVVAYEAAITLKIIDVRKGAIIDTASAQVRKVNVNREKASIEAMKEAGNAAAKKLVAILKAKTGAAQ